ncbi:hypothetical protein MNL02_05560 [Bartonella krasnovii]|uniref:hypothetical protein n=1 Tax=Bartonella krasnovii TaxID=2267275 RepID=UPI001F4CA05A|nr:hypothetical protein [Bartonella krasnovii]UNF45061.1 hypothetical protein MNL06_05725 [Bartonella krasnovii]UNF48191.1 hypothetical protein MNL04_05540 [Bartonella krasnovii]UNF51547.1 hypothetical protein MNL02_05560 [Bartonella krasnovii]
MDKLFCSQVVKERDDAVQRLDSVEFEKENAQRGWNDTMKVLGVAVEDLKRIALEQQELYLALLKMMPNNKQLTYKYEITQKRNAAIFERLEKVFTLFEHVEKRTEAFRVLNKVDQLKDQSQSLHTLEVISKHHGHIDGLNKELERLDHEVDRLNNKLQSLKKISR